jgi:flagellar hook-associated protein 1 FlgK
MLANIGVRVQSAQLSADQSGSIASAAKTAQASKSGVNLDEEAARLIQYQQSYQAAAKMLQIAQAVMDTLLEVAAR